MAAPADGAYVEGKTYYTQPGPPQQAIENTDVPGARSRDDIVVDSQARDRSRADAEAGQAGGATRALESGLVRSARAREQSAPKPASSTVAPLAPRTLQRSSGLRRDKVDFKDKDGDGYDDRAGDVKDL
ncbi:hypothetical protein GX586_12105 [bacterium]|nr:hypothetical protein [bacterium]